MLSQKRVNEIIKENSGAFKSLEDFEKTGRVITKTRMNFTIDKEVAKRFKEYCRKHALNMSNEVEKFLKKFE